MTKQTGLALAPFASLFALSMSACDEETVNQVHPRILVCAGEETVDGECNRALELGERHVTVEHVVLLWVRNRGEAPLGVSNISTDEEWASAAPSSLAVELNAQERVELRLVPQELGEQTVTVTLVSDDPETPSLAIPVRFTGTPKPVPLIELCLVDVAPEVCDTTLDVDFGFVRRTQRESRSLVMRNKGTAVLEVRSVIVVGEPSVAGELTIATSTRPGSLAPGDEAPVLLLYEPEDGIDDAIAVVFRSNDEVTPQARLVVSGSSEENRPPLADAVELVTGESFADVTVGLPVVVDGAGSRDVEGDPLVYEWTLEAPAGSQAVLDDPSAGRASFVPDFAGQYLARLWVYDSLGQRSVVPSLVTVTAVPSAALRVKLTWSQGGDVDLHLVPVGASLFSSSDCHFGAPRPDLGAAGDASDDPELLTDSESSPGAENLVYVTPAPGSYRVYAHYYATGSDGLAADARVTVTLDDAAFPVVDDTRSLQSGCALWYVADVEFPGGLISTANAGVTTLCP